MVIMTGTDQVAPHLQQRVLDQNYLVLERFVVLHFRKPETEISAIKTTGRWAISFFLSTTEGKK